MTKVSSVEVLDTTWSRLLALRHGEAIAPDAAFRLYGPIAGARGRMVLAQVGQSLDGRVATAAGDARDISGHDGLLHLHRCRALVDAVIVGVTTVKADDPRLSVRMVRGPSPIRVVIDCHGELDGGEGLFHDGGSPVIVFQSLHAEGCVLSRAEVIKLRTTSCGIDPQEILEELAKRNLNRVLVEGGARTIARFIDAGLVDRLHVAVSPLIIGSGPSGITLPPIQRLSCAHRPATKVYDLGSDILFDCQLRPKGEAGRVEQKIAVAMDV